MKKAQRRLFTGELLHKSDRGVYKCAACGEVLFSSDTKYDSGSGWPAFYDAVDSKKISLEDDYDHGMFRIEVKCANCGSHLGHVFDESSNPTGKYYCINSACLSFAPEENPKKDK